MLSIAYFDATLDEVELHSQSEKDAPISPYSKHQKV